MSFIASALSGLGGGAGAVVGGIGSLIGGALNSGAAGKASAAQQAAAQQATQTQLSLLNATSQMNAPGRNLGYGADSALASLFGIPDPNAAGTTAGYGANAGLTALGTPGGTAPAASGQTGGGGGPGGIGAPGSSSNGSTGTNANGNPNYAGFYNTPGYQFALGQSQQAIQRGASARGNLYSAGTLNQLNQNAAGYASQNYNNYVSQLMGLAGIGQNANSSTQSAATTAGNNIAQNQLNAGTANASGILGGTGAWTSAIGNAAGQLGNYSMLTNLQNQGLNSGSYVNSAGQNVYTGVKQNNGLGGGLGDLTPNIYTGVEQNGGLGGGIGNIVQDL